jgi:hypothetical protein
MIIVLWPGLSEPDDCAWKPPMCRSDGKVIDQLRVALVELVSVTEPP